MKLLVLDASTQLCCVAVQVNGKIVQSTRDIARSHSEFIIPMIDKCLQQANLQLSELDVIGYGKGPGSFTGLRLIAAIVQAFAFSYNLPVVAISSLQAMAQTIFQQYAVKQVLVCEDARIKEVYWADFQLTKGIMQPKIAETCSAPKYLIEYLTSIEKSSWPMLVGSGWQAYPELIELLSEDTNSLMELPTINSGLLMLTQYFFEQGSTVFAAEALPSYLQSLHYKKNN